MSHHDRSFRKSTFGGFNRQDVAAYLQTMAKEHREESEALRSVADKLRAECNTYKRQLDEHQQSQDEIAQQSAGLSDALAAKDNEILELRRGAEAELETVMAKLRNYQTELDALNERTQDMDRRVNAAESHASQTEEQMRSMERRVVAEEDRARDAESRAGQAEERVRDMEQRVSAAESRAGQSEEWARDLEQRASAAESRAGQSEEWARDLEQRASAAESRAGQSEEWARDLEQRASAAESRAGQAEDRARDLEQRALTAESRAAQAEERRETELSDIRRELAVERERKAILLETARAQEFKLKQYEEQFRELELEAGGIMDFKARLAEIEQAARRRAEVIESEARRHAQLAEESLLRDTADKRSRLAVLRREAAAAAATAVSELDKARMQLEYVDAVFGGLNERIDEITGESNPVIRSFVPEEFN